MSKTLITIAFILVSATGSLTAPASTLRAMSGYEVNELLQSAPGADKATAPAAKASVSPDNIQQPFPSVNVTAHDLITKVYGFIDARSSRQDCIDRTRESINLTPQQVDNDFWLDSQDGYRLSYDGMSPRTAALARIGDNDSVAEYCYFFLFPYSGNAKEAGTEAQAQFGGELLQELSDMDADWGADRNSDDLFEVVGSYAGNLVSVRLLDEQQPGGDNSRPAASDPGTDGRYILMFIVQPGAFTPEDDTPAIL